MTYEEACKFFLETGNVGRSITDLSRNKPTINQLDSACWVAFNTNKQPEEKINQARLAILDYWREHENSIRPDDKPL